MRINYKSIEYQPSTHTNFWTNVTTDVRARTTRTVAHSAAFAPCWRNDSLVVAVELLNGKCGVNYSTWPQNNIFAVELTVYLRLLQCSEAHTCPSWLIPTDTFAFGIQQTGAKRLKRYRSIEIVTV